VEILKIPYTLLGILPVKGFKPRKAVKSQGKINVIKISFYQLK